MMTMERSSKEYVLEYFSRWNYFAYRFRAFKAIVKLYEDYFKLIKYLTGLRLLGLRKKL